MSSLIYACAAAMVWGFWAFLPRLAVDRLGLLSAMVWEAIGAFAVPVTCLLLLRGRLSSGGGAWIWVLATGVCGLVGAMLYYRAVQLAGSRTSAVMVIGAMYPVVAILLAAVILRERPNSGQLAGIGLALAGVAVLVWSTPAALEPSTAASSEPSSAVPNSAR